MLRSKKAPASSAWRAWLGLPGAKGSRVPVENQDLALQQGGMSRLAWHGLSSSIIATSPRGRLSDTVTTALLRFHQLCAISCWLPWLAVGVSGCGEDRAVLVASPNLSSR